MKELEIEIKRDERGNIFGYKIFIGNECVHIFRGSPNELSIFDIREEVKQFFNIQVEAARIREK